MDRRVPTLASRLFSVHAAVIATGLALGWLVSAAGAGIGVGVLGGIFFLILSLKSLRPAIILSVSIMMVFGRGELYQYDIPFAGGGLKPSDLLLAVVLISWAVRVLVFKRVVLRLPKVFCSLVLVYMAVATASALGSLTSGIYFKDALLELRPLLQYLLVIPLIAEFDSAALRQSVWILLGVSVFSSVRILVNYWMGVGEVLLYGEGIRVVLLELGAYLPPVILGFTFYLFGLRPVLSLSVGLLNLTALAVTFFRSAYLGLTSGLAFMFLVAEPAIKRLMLKLAVFVAVGGCIIWVAHSVISPKAVNPIESVVTRVLSLREFKEDISSLHRLREWEAASALIARSPIWGNGLGTRVVFESPMYDAESEQLGYLSHDIYMHNSYMWLLVKMGAVGLASFMFLPLTAMWTAVRSLRFLADPAVRATQLAMCGVLAGNLVISMFGPMFNIDNMTPINAFILGSVFILAREAQNPWENEI
ncbi:O-antigen ligase family protein [Fundidesulfovibrio terrae]|uniref:O-antigen ligase family protein n=1 Tax=Fundidesulfovibrio terrae TaxID=2922866 RepID=UPI001FAED2A9|nr:O-antigen ligase family protein [Fundidesulfovibrio terrae]